METSKSHSQNAKKRRPNVHRKYKNLDSTTKHKLNSEFLEKVLNKGYKRQKAANLSNASEHKNKSAINNIFPSAMYEKYGIPQNPKFASKQPRVRVQSSKNQIPKIKTGVMQNEDKRENMTPTASLEFQRQERVKVTYFYLHF